MNKMPLVRHPLLTQIQSEWLRDTLSKYNVCAVTVHGSNLYGLQTINSDVDLKAVVIPTMEDLLLGKGLRAKKVENNLLNIEMEIKTLPSFLSDAMSCDTNTIDMLHAPDNMTLFTTDLWDELKDKRSCMYSKNMSGLIGYVKSQTAKYGHKIDRCVEMAELEEFAKSCPGKTIGDVTRSFLSKGKSYKYISTKSDDINDYIEVCGKLYIFKAAKETLIGAMHSRVEKYGSRTQKGRKEGLDTKSTSHVLRVIFEVLEIAEHRTVTFPLIRRDEVYAVKQGLVNKDAVSDLLETYFDKAMALIEESDLPEETDENGEFLKIISKYYKSKL